MRSIFLRYLLDRTEYKPEVTTITFEGLDALGRDIADLFTVDNVTLDYPEPGHARLRGRLLCDLATCFDDLRGRLRELGGQRRA